VPANTPEEEEDHRGDAINGERTASIAPHVDPFFAALEGPELDTPKVSNYYVPSCLLSLHPFRCFQIKAHAPVLVRVVFLQSLEALVQPSDKQWPFLLLFPVSTFGMCLGVSSQAILYKTIVTAPPTAFLHVSIMCTITAVYACKVVFFFEAVRREYYHPVRVNFFFAQWIACLFLAMGVPPSVATNLPGWLWYALMVSVLCLELKIYGQWMSSGTGGSPRSPTRPTTSPSSATSWARCWARPWGSRRGRSSSSPSGWRTTPCSSSRSTSGCPLIRPFRITILYHNLLLFIDILCI
jgi:hypothetical protein